MPYPVGAYRVNINAALAEGEVMVNTVWMIPDDFDAPLITPQFVADRVQEKWTGLILGGNDGSLAVAGQFADTTIWTNATAYKVDGLGRATEQAESNFGAGVKGTNSSRLPGQLALCATLNTARAGRSGRGRIFLGGLGAGTLSQPGKYATGFRDALAVALGLFYTALRDSTLQPDVIRPCVVSPTLGISNRITTISVGDVYDTMRSRRSGLVEQRVSADVDV